MLSRIKDRCHGKARGLLCLSKIDREKVFANVLDKKEGFTDYKNNCLRKTQNSNFSKGVSPSFWSKI